MDRINADEVRTHYDLRKCWPWFTPKHKQSAGGRYATDVCPVHDDQHPSLLIFWDQARCMTCGFLADIFTVYQMVHQCSFYEALASLADGAMIAAQGQPMGERVSITMNPNIETAPVNPASIERFEPLAGDVLECDSLRGLEEGTAKKFGLRHDGNGIAIFPIVLNGELVNVKLYDTQYKAKIKAGVNAIKWRPMDVGRGKPPYNADGIKDERSVVVVESEKDVVFLDQIGIPAIASGGAAVWNENMSKVLVNADEINVLGDYDEAGWKFCDRVTKHVRRAVPIYWNHLGVDLKGGYDAADFVQGGGSRDAFMRMIDLSRSVGGRSVWAS